MVYINPNALKISATQFSEKAIFIFSRKKDTGGIPLMHETNIMSSLLNVSII